MRKAKNMEISAFYHPFSLFLAVFPFCMQRSQCTFQRAPFFSEELVFRKKNVCVCAPHNIHKAQTTKERLENNNTRHAHNTTKDFQLKLKPYNMHHCLIVYLCWFSFYAIFIIMMTGIYKSRKTGVCPLFRNNARIHLTSKKARDRRRQRRQKQEKTQTRHVFYSRVLFAVSILSFLFLFILRTYLFPG